MTQKHIRWLLMAVVSGLVTFVIVRRRQQLASLPRPLIQHAERFVIPWTTLERRPQAAEGQTASAQAEEITEEDELSESGDTPLRKVSSGYRISFHGKRYGPLPEALIGKYVDVEARDGQLFILHGGTPIANFELQS